MTANILVGLCDKEKSYLWWEWSWDLHARNSKNHWETCRRAIILLFASLLDQDLIYFFLMHHKDFFLLLIFIKTNQTSCISLFALASAAAPYANVPTKWGSFPTFDVSANRFRGALLQIIPMAMGASTFDACQLIKCLYTRSQKCCFLCTGEKHLSQ